MWKCTRCEWSGPEPEMRAQRHPGGWHYYAPLCPNCGRYFNERELNIMLDAVMRPARPETR